MRQLGNPCTAYNGVVHIFPWYWAGATNPEKQEATLQEIAEVLAEEVYHLIDQERYSNSVMNIVDAPYWMVRRINRRVANSSRLIRLLGKLEQFLYDRSIWERRAKRYALKHGVEYADALRPFFAELVEHYTSFETG